MKLYDSIHDVFTSRVDMETPWELSDSGHTQQRPLCVEFPNFYKISELGRADYHFLHFVR